MDETRTSRAGWPWRVTHCLAAGTATLLLLGGSATAQEAEGTVSDAATAPAAAEPSTDERMDELEETVVVLIEEIDSLRKIFAVPEEGLMSYSGLGPAASKVFQRDRGLSIGGYGEVLFTSEVSEQTGRDEFDALRMVLYVGYKFNDWIIFNSELEFEHAGTGGGGSVSTEMMTLDFLFTEWVNARAGLILLPMGFINEVHEPVFFIGNSRPVVEQRLIPSTWRENGGGFYGSFLDDRIQYRMFGVNGFDGSGFSAAGFRGGRQNGGRALADNFAFVGRVDTEPIDGVLIGGSVYYGKSGQNQEIDPAAVPGTGGQLPDMTTTIWEIHMEVERYGAHFRGLYSETFLEDTVEASTVLGETLARRMNGGYAEFAYDVLPLVFPDTAMSLEPYYRYERVNTQRNVRNAIGPADPTQDQTLHVVGLQYKPHPQVVLKLDYRNIDSEGGPLPDEVQAGFGFVF